MVVRDVKWWLFGYKTAKTLREPRDLWSGEGGGGDKGPEGGEKERWEERNSEDRKESEGRETDRQTERQTATEREPENFNTQG